METDNMDRFKALNDKEKFNYHGEQTVIDILNELDSLCNLKSDALKTDGFFIQKRVEILNKECGKSKEDLIENFKRWIMFWSNIVHEDHQNDHDEHILDCKHPACESAMKSIEELK